MTTYYPFTPNPQSPFSFRPTLDGNPYTILVVWNLFGQRYYLNCTDQFGNLVFYLAVTESLNNYTINNLSFDLESMLATGTVSGGFGGIYNIGDTANLTVTGANPTGYNGTYKCLITSATTFTYELPADPGQISNTGSLSNAINMVAGYFEVSTLVYRNQQFEVEP